MKLIAQLLVNTLLVYVIAEFMPGVYVADLTAALITAIVLGIINTFIKPVLTILSLPLTILTLGLFSLVINALMILLVDFLVGGFSVNGFLTALLFSLILSIGNGVINSMSK